VLCIREYLVSGIFAAIAGDFAAGLNLVFETSVNDFALSPADATARITFNADGTCSYLGDGVLTGGWFTPGVTPVGWSVRRTINSGALQTDAGAGWLALSSGRSFGCQETASGARTANVTFEFSPDGGTTVVGSRSTTFTADVEI
jgi:hypothetical protein